MPPVSNTNQNPYIDEVVYRGERSARHQHMDSAAELDEIDEITIAGSAQAHENEFNEEDDLSKLGIEGEFDPEIERDEFDNIDEFVPSGIRREQRGNEGDGHEEEDRRRRRAKNIDRVKKNITSSRNASRGFWPFMDDMIAIDPYVSGFADNEGYDDDEAIEREFANWNNFDENHKTLKLKPPAPSQVKPSYIREEFQVNRNPHLWKSNPNKDWILTFGPPRTRNHWVSDILYKYQNETISKDA